MSTKRFAVIGDSVSHSLSPLMHTGWFADHEIDATYEALPLRSDDPVAAIRALTGFTGVNVTVPHKEAAARAAARSEGAVANVLRWEPHGSISAFNTDGAGFLDSLDESVPGWRARVKQVFIIGAGGAALGIAEALSPHVSAVEIANRTAPRAEEVAATIRNGRALPWSELERGFADANLIVQTTTLGMSGQPACDWPIAVCKQNTIIADIVYRPLETDLLRGARMRGLDTVDGLGMLIHQGARSFELWFGIKPDAAKARQRLMAALV